MTTSRPLAGLAIGVTRPEHQAQALCDLIAAAGGEPVLVPALEITPIPDPGPLLAAARRLDCYHWAIFISPNAVAHALPALQAAGIPGHLRFAAIGPSTAAALKQAGVPDVLLPAGPYDSEHLLARPELVQVAGQSILLLRGTGGREVLADTLARRGAHVTKISCYERRPAGIDAGALLQRWRTGHLQALTVTSSEALRYLFDQVGEEGQAYLRRTPVFVPHRRIAETAQTLGLEQVILTAPADAGLLQGLFDWRGRQAPGG
jgi:uroporphyrinogen-III synthase